TASKNWRGSFVLCVIYVEQYVVARRLAQGYFNFLPDRECVAEVTFKNQGDGCLTGKSHNRLIRLPHARFKKVYTLHTSTLDGSTCHSGCASFSTRRQIPFEYFVNTHRPADAGDGEQDQAHEQPVDGK